MNINIVCVQAAETGMSHIITYQTNKMNNNIKSLYKCQRE